MERTGGDGKPTGNPRDDRFTRLLVNAAHVKAAPGRTTDGRDGEGLAGAPWAMLRHGLLQGRFGPARPQRGLRELTRSRTSRVRERAAAVARLQKTPAGADVKLAGVATAVMGGSGRQILARPVAGPAEATARAPLARGTLRATLPGLERALVGRFGAHQRFLVARQPAHVDDLAAAIAALAAAIAALAAAIGERLPPVAAEVRRLATIPGVGRLTAEAVPAELGPDMGRFPGAKHVASWAGTCPGNREGAGKRQRGRTRPGTRWRRGALVAAAKAAGRTRHPSPGAQDRRLVRRRGKQQATVALGHSILVIADHVLKEGPASEDLGPTSVDDRDRHAAERRLVHRLDALGYALALTPIAAA